MNRSTSETPDGPPPPPHPSLWAATAIAADPWPQLAGEVRADVAVIGAGFTGLSAALHLAERGTDTVVIDAVEPGYGASGRTGGQVIPGLKLDPDELDAKFGPELGPRIVTAVGSGPDLVFSLIERHAIACHPVRKGWIQPAHGPGAIDTIRRRAEQWAKRGAPVEMLDRARTASLLGTETYYSGWLDRRGGCVQPLSYARGLAQAAVRQGARLFVRSPAEGVSRVEGGWRIATPAGAVTASRVILATNAYTTAGVWPRLKESVVPVFSFQVATAPLSDNVKRTILPQGHVASDTRRLLWYFRFDHQGRLLMGGRGPFREDPGPADADRHYTALRTLFPQLGDVAFDFHWAGKVAITTDHLPHLHELAPGVVAGLGFNGRGVAMGTMMGKLLADLTLGAARNEIPFPISDLSPIPLHGLHRLGVMAFTQYYRWLDRKEARDAER